ncbi:MAG TPA: isopentenyl phosphate kinase [Thermoplasmata archaeon]|nr:isopentenyl phosphate kinase [Thermoplasmata archaeon]
MHLVKLGGSVITDKRKVTTLRPGALRELAGEIARSGEDVILVHGAGSFGHIKAGEHRLAAGYVDDAQLPAVSEVQRDVRFLNVAVLDALRKAGLHAVSLPPSAIARLDDGVLKDLDLDVFRRYRDLGFTPVTFGDVVLDGKRWFSICSGDLLMLALAAAFHPESATFVADVDGVYTADPKRVKGAKLLREVSAANVASIDTTTAPVEDVTGGLAGKLARMLEVAKLVDRCVLVNGLKKGRLLAALRGERVVGTRVLP